MQFKVSALVMATALATGLALAPKAHAVTVDLNLVSSFPKTSPFGLAFDGTNLWYSAGINGIAREMTTAGVDTGNTTPGSFQAMGWTGSQLVTGDNGAKQIRFIDRFTGMVTKTIAVTGANSGPQFGLVDGLDFDHNEFWWSPDVGNVFRLDSNGNNVLGPDVAVIGGAGGFSGVERVDVGADSFLVVVNDAFMPRRLSVFTLNGTEIGSTTLANARYEDLAFDGRFLYAADLFGNKIDKIDLMVNGQSIFVPPADMHGIVPEPCSLSLLSLGGLPLLRRLRRRRPALA